VLGVTIPRPLRRFEAGFLAIAAVLDKGPELKVLDSIDLTCVYPAEGLVEEVSSLPLPR
jgi:hypothetical protein